MTLTQTQTVRFDQAKLRVFSYFLDVVNFLNCDCESYKQTVFTERVPFDEPSSEASPCCVISPISGIPPVGVGLLLLMVWTVAPVFAGIAAMRIAARFDDLGFH
jgi:hypothetical protein